MIHRGFYFHTRVAALLIVCECFSGTWAAETASDSGAPALEELVVTARRVDERQQRVPISITAFSQQDLSERRVETATDLQNFTPSLSVAGTLTRNDESLTLRGIGATNSSVGGGPGVVAYLAEVPYTASGPGLFFDLQSLQVLKGPQGTLFGRNTTGGAVLLEPVKPSLTKVEGYGSATYGNYDHVIGESAVSLPIISEVLALRVAARIEDQAGTTYDVNLHKRLDNRNNASVRAGLLFQPSDALTSYTLVQNLNINESASGSVLTLINPAGPFAAQLAPLFAAQLARGPRDSAMGVLPIFHSQNLAALNNTSVKLADFLTFKNVASYTRRRSNYAVDGDGTTLEINDLLGADPGGWAANNRTATEEAQLQLRDVGPISGQTGAYYEDTKDVSPRTFNAVAALGNFRTHQFDAAYGTRSEGVYGQATLDLGSGVKLTGGYRETWDKFTESISLELPAAGICLGSPNLPPNCMTPELSGKSNGPSWIGNIAWQATPTTLLYGTLSSGYKSGGFNDAVGSLVGPSSPYFSFRPEKVTAAETGVKRDWEFAAEGRARTNVSLFYNRYNDIQRSDNALIGTPPTVFNATVTTNAVKATIKGIEFEGTLLPFRGLTFNLGYSYLDSSYTRYIDPLGNDKSGLPFQYTPKNKAVGEGLVNLPVPGSVAAETQLRLSYTYQSRVQVAADFEPQGTIPAYGLFNARLQFNHVAGTAVDFSLFATNLTDKLYAVASNANYFSTGTVTRIYGDPRMYGATASVRF